MPPNDPGLWRMLMDALDHVWPHVYAALISFIVALLRALLAGGKITAAMLEACLCGALTLAVFPILEYFGLNANLAVAVGSGIAFLGVEWFKSHLAAIAGKLIDKWIEK